MLRVCSLLVLVFTGVPAMADVSGPMRVIDGDTIEIAGERIRLFGIDAPENDQRCGGNGVPTWACGAWASGEVRARYAGRVATCQRIDTDRYGRMVARCDVDGVDLGRTLVQSGLAFAYLKYAFDYAGEEKFAAAQGRGLHAVGVQSPESFRSSKRRTRQLWNARTAPKGCVIKGNISQNNGDRIYHVPGQDWYDATIVKTAKGERWFCSEDEARAAGWRAARN